MMTKEAVLELQRELALKNHPSVSNVTIFPAFKGQIQLAHGSF